MPLVVRTWNVFHGNASPPERNAFLEQMIRLVTADAPDVVCLQELPLWSLRRLERWSGMQVVGQVASHSRLGPFWELGRVLTDIHHGRLRSLLTGQANAILLSRRLRLLQSEWLVLNPLRTWRTHRASRAWTRNRRVCQLVRVDESDRTVLIANLHLTSVRGNEAPAEAELARAVEWIDTAARPGEPTLLCGDFNLRPHLGGRGFTEPGPGIDHVLVRSGAASTQLAWPEERRRVDGRLLSDHAPVEVVVE